MAAWNLVLYKPHCCVVCAATRRMAERLMSVMAVGVAMLRYSKIKKIKSFANTQPLQIKLFVQGSPQKKKSSGCSLKNINLAHAAA